MEQQEIGKRIVGKLNEAIDGELIEDIFPALCWMLGAVGTEASASKESFMAIVTKAVSSAYDYNITENEDATTH